MIRLCHDATRSATLDEVWRSHIFLPDDHGLPRLNPLPLWQRTGRPGRAPDAAGRARPATPRNHPGLYLPRTVLDHPSNFKPFKIARTTSRMLPDVPGPSRTVPDRLGNDTAARRILPRTAPDSIRGSPGQSGRSVRP